ncbi:MAG: hypothetical protein GF317_14880 [Candidatus Lokiarchaeota archaeon]|nr:hypothetical protein [Candidatus Lokiarchaeota archaeon]
MEKTFIKGDKVKFTINDKEYQGEFDTYYGEMCGIWINTKEGDDLKIIPMEDVELVKMQGFKTYRHEQNPMEKQLHDNFLKEHIEAKYCCDLSLLIFPPANSNQTHAVDHLSEREKRIILSTIQWLGSPVGQGFLRENGIELTKEKQKEIRKKLNEIY